MHPVASRILRNVRRRLTWHRRWIAAACAAAAVFTGFSAYADARGGNPVVAAARELPAGHVLDASDLVLVRLPLEATPAGIVGAPADVIGRRTALPLRAREPVTDVRLLDGGLLNALGDSQRAVTLRLADSAAATLIAPGSLIDVYAATDGLSPPRAVAAAVLVVQVLAADDRGSAVVVAADTATAGTLAAAQGSGPVSIAVRGTGTRSAARSTR